MFGDRYFGFRYFGNRFFGGAGQEGQPEPQVDRGDAYYPVRRVRRIKYLVSKEEYLRRLFGQKDEPPAPTARARKAVVNEIVKEIEAGGLGVEAKPQIARLVREQVKAEWRPSTDWAALANSVRRIMEQAQAEAERIEQEIEDEDEFVLLMAA